jgi:hypothetical protein
MGADDDEFGMAAVGKADQRLGHVLATFPAFRNMALHPADAFVDDALFCFVQQARVPAESQIVQLVGIQRTHAFNRHVAQAGDMYQRYRRFGNFCNANGFIQCFFCRLAAIYGNHDMLIHGILLFNTGGKPAVLACTVRKACHDVGMRCDRILCLVLAYSGADLPLSN